MLLNATKYQGYTAFTVSELLRENQQGEVILPRLGLNENKQLKTFYYYFLLLSSVSVLF